MPRVNSGCNLMIHNCLLIESAALKVSLVACWGLKYTSSIYAEVSVERPEPTYASKARLKLDKTPTEIDFLTDRDAGNSTPVQHLKPTVIRIGDY